MSSSRDVFERLVQQTVRNVLFQEPSGRSVQKQHAFTTLPSKMLVPRNNKCRVPKMSHTTEACPGSLIHLLISLSEKGSDNPGEENSDNNDDEACLDSWITDCVNWSIERLKAEKARIKRYLRICQKTTQTTAQVSIIHEAYAILKLLLLERDPGYRECLQQTIGCHKLFQASLHVLLTLYATYFERAHGRQVHLPAFENLVHVALSSFIHLTNGIYRADLQERRREAYQNGL
ncbi:unnamed protein product [Phytophthora fragariaefolia]|uniref:Unnamed protein product n=1 Tax=Phytophthora fragariaefolia TaxID=1490495 RepID=A0A9W6UDI7_9STRA|nr:unnamed protein product [Phytophthora fragariaefolia]